MSNRTRFVSITRPRTTFLLVSFLVVTLLLAGPSSRPRADVVILKDGYTIHGKLSDEKTVIEDIVVKKANGFTTVDDGARFTIFSAHYKAVGDVNDFNKFQQDIRLTTKYYQVTAYKLRPVMVFRGETEFGDPKVTRGPAAKWQRELTFATEEGLTHILQQITLMTPHYILLRSTTHTWNCYYLTRELGFMRVRELLATHPELIEKKGEPDIDKRGKIIRFLIQADWLSEAEDEINQLQKDLPTEAKRIADFRKDIADIRRDRLFADIERARETGRHGYALSSLKRLPKTELPRAMADKVLAMKVEYETATQKFEDAKRHLSALRAEMKGANADLGAALGLISKELHLDTIKRLDSFVTLAAQTERDLKAGKKPFYSNEQVVAAGITGWLQGDNAVETKVETARKLLFARDMALNYLRCNDSAKRATILDDYGKDPKALKYDELEKLISLLPPPKAQEELPTEPTVMKTEVIPSFGGQVKFMLQLPPEYQHGRPYPLLLVFPDKDQRPREVLEKMGEIAAKYGYVVAVVDWEGEDYTNSPEAMALVTGLVRHMRRAFQIDSDKVFLMGYGNGATLAMDVAAGHPDLFAGIVPICPTPNHDYLILGKYSTNFQNLPLYMVMGDRAGTEIIRTVRAVYTDWMKLGYPALCVSYKGRGNDHFDEEIPYIFDWMSRKTRVAPVTGVGSDAMPYHTIRTCDNRFFWLSTEEIMKGCQHPLHRKNGSAYMSARLSEGNVISVAPLGLNQVTIWIHRGMVDFNKPVSVRLEQAQREVFRKQLTPKISVLLEDLYERGDRQRPALQRIDIVNINKGVLKVNSP